MTDATYTVEADGPQAMADQDICLAVGQTLQRAYPNYPWMVGAHHAAGTAVIDLPEVMKPLRYRKWGYLLHMASLMGPGGVEKVIRAGGEILERMGLPRGVAPVDYKERARQNGLDVGNAVTKSRA